MRERERVREREREREMGRRSSEEYQGGTRTEGEEKENETIKIMTKIKQWMLFTVISFNSNVTK